MKFLTLRSTIRSMLAQTVADLRALKATIRELSRAKQSTPHAGYLKTRATVLCTILAQFRGKLHMKTWHTHGGGCTDFECTARTFDADPHQTDQAAFLRRMISHDCREVIFTEAEREVLKLALQAQRPLVTNRAA